MPLCLDRPSFGHLDPKYVWAKSPVEFGESDADCIEIGLVNNMPGAALEATERQFRTLLGAAARGIVVRLTLLALPDVPRTDAGRRHVSSFYTDFNDLWAGQLDGLIVTGTEPRMPNLRNEPYWGSLVKLLEWAEHNTHSSVWSCLAAHAALLSIDGIVRRPLSHKRFGVFECAKISDHLLTSGVPARLHMPHSRWNEAPEDALTACGYGVLTRSEDAGVDAFVKRRKSLLVFFQGHPEYDRDTLLLEYRRDIGRFLRGESAAYPSMPRGYFDEDTADALAAFQKRAVTNRREELLRELPTGFVAGRVDSSWSSAAVCIYRSWLQYLCTQKARWRRRRYRAVRSVSPQENRALLTLGAVAKITVDKALQPAERPARSDTHCEFAP
jgi:homoserine O-succinyltransferase